mmetsp:Transcript_75108/g.179302  ORF Transcript_75108/g.179302 Transcript_75108/m.179302 type:complete len:3027 (+) Transcript_75108:71-9151(+)
MKVTSKGGDAILVEAENLVLRDSAEFRLGEVDARLVNLKTPKLDVDVQEGVFAMKWDEATARGHVKLRSHQADVVLQAAGPLTAALADEETRSRTVAQGTTLAEPGKTLTTGILADLSSHGGFLQLRGGAAESEFRGAAQKAPALTKRSETELETIARWIQDQKNRPWVVYLTVLGPDLPQGRWLLMSSSIYLAFPVHFFALFSAGMLAPQPYEATVSMVGLSAKPSCQAHRADPSGSASELRSLEACSGEQQENEAFQLLWRWAVDEKILDERSGHMIWEPKVGPVELLGQRRDLLRRSEVPLSATWPLLLAALLNALGSLMLAVYVLVMLQQQVIPWALGIIVELQLQVISSLRLTHSSAQGKWRLMAAAIHAPHGVILRWVARPKQNDFHSIQVSVRGKGPQGEEHNFSCQCERTHVQVPEVSSMVRSGDDQRNGEYVVQLVLTAGKDPELPHEEMKPWFEYSFQLQGLDNLGAAMEVSSWSSRVLLPPPWTVFDYPQLLSQVFFPIEVPSFDLFLDQFGSTQEMDCRLGLTDIEVALNGEERKTLTLRLSWQDRGGGAKTTLHLRRDAKCPGVTEHRDWLKGFVEDTKNIFGNSVKSVENIHSEGHVLDAGKIFTRNGQQRLDRQAGTVILQRSDLEQKTVELSIELPSGERVGAGFVDYEQLVTRWSEQRHTWAQGEPLELSLSGGAGKLRCNVVMGDARGDMLEMPKSVFSSLVPGAVWFHGEQRIVHWYLPGLLKHLHTLGFLANQEVPNEESLLFTLAAVPLAGGEAVPLAGEFEAADLRMAVEVPNSKRLRGVFELRIDTCWLQLTESLARKASFAVQKVGFTRKPRGSRWCKLQELYDSGLVHTQLGGAWTTEKVSGKSRYECREAHQRLASHRVFFESPVLVQEFELAYASWCRQHTLQMRQVDDLAFEENKVLPIHISEMQLKMVQGLRPAMPFEQHLRCVVTDEGVKVSTADVQLISEESTKTLTCQAQEVSVLQGFRWRQKPWRFEADLASRGSFAWLLRSQVANQRRILRALIAGFGFLENIGTFCGQVVIFTAPSWLAFVGLALYQHFGLMYQPSFMMRSQTSSWMASEWFIQPSHLKSSVLKESHPLEVVLPVLVVLDLVSTLCSMGYMYFARYHFQCCFKFVAACSWARASFICFLFLYVALTLLLWILLGCILNPEKLMPVAVMIFSGFGLAISLWNQLTNLKDEMLKLIFRFIDPLFGKTLDRLLKELDREDAQDRGSSTNLNKARKQYKMYIVDEITDDMEKALSKLQAKQEKQQILDTAAEDAGEAEEEESDLQSSSAPSEYLELLAEGGLGIQERTSKEVKNNMDKLEDIYGRLCERAPIVETVRGTLEEPKQLALKIFEERKEQMELIETRFLSSSAGGSQMTELYEEKLEHLQKGFISVLQESFDENQLLNKVSFFINSMLPQLISLRAQRLTAGAGQVRRAIHNKWPQEKKGGLKLDLKLKLTETMSASTLSAGESSPSSHGSSAFSNEEVVGMTLYEFFCSDSINIFPQLSLAGRDCPDFEDVRSQPGAPAMQRISFKEENGKKEEVVQEFDMTLDDLVNIEGIPKYSKTPGEMVTWSVELKNTHNELHYAFDVQVQGNAASFRHRSGRTTTAYKPSAVYFVNPREKVQLFLRRTRSGVALWVSGHRARDLDFRPNAEEAKWMAQQKVTRIQMKGLNNTDLQARSSTKEALLFQGEALDTFELQETICEQFNKFVLTKAFGRKSTASSRAVELRRMQVVRVTRELLDGALWWDEYDRLVRHILDIKVKPEYLKAYYTLETKDTLVMPLNRVAPSIMWLVGRMLWPTAFVLMCRHFDLWPEVFDLSASLPAKDAADIADKVRDEQYDLLEEEVEQTEREPLQLRAGFANAVKALEKEYYDQVNREIGFQVREQGADRRKLRTLKEKKVRLLTQHTNVSNEVTTIKEFEKQIDDGVVDADIRDKKPEYQAYVKLKVEELDSVKKQSADIDDELRRLTKSLKATGTFIEEKKGQLRLRTQMEQKELELQKLLKSLKKSAKASSTATSKSYVFSRTSRPDMMPPNAEVLRLRADIKGLQKTLSQSMRKAFTWYMEIVANIKIDQEVLEKEQASAMADEEVMDNLLAQIQERQNLLEDMDLNNLSILYPMYQLEVAMRGKEEAAMREAHVMSDLDEGFEEVIKPLWTKDLVVTGLEVWDADSRQLRTDPALQKKMADWILEAKLQQVMSQRRDELLQEIQQRQISRPPDPLDIEEADDAEWRTSAAFKYLWEDLAESSSDPEAFSEEMLSPKMAVPFLMQIFFEPMVLVPGVIDTDVEASVDLEQLPQRLQEKVAQKRLFRVTDREVDRWRYISEEEDLAWKTMSGDLIANAVSKTTEIFMGSVCLQQVGERQYMNGLTGNVWSRFDKGMYHRGKGMWFDAFVEVCNRIGMPIGRTSSWILWNLVTSEELMRTENVDIILCKEVRLVAELRAVILRKQELGSFQLYLNSDRMTALRAKGRAHPRPELLEDYQEEAAGGGDDGASETQSNAASEAESGAESDPEKAAVSEGKAKSRKNRKGKKRKARQEKHVKISAVKITKLQSPNLIFLDHAQDTVTVQLMVGDRVEGVGCFDWKQTREEAVLASEQTVQLLTPITREPVGSVVMKLRLDDCYKEVFAALDSDETQQTAAQQLEQKERVAEIERRKASAFLPQDSLHPLHSRTAENDPDTLKRRAVSDWEWGFANPVTVRENLLKVLNHTPFVSKSMFYDFLTSAQINLPDEVIDSLWDDKLEKTCPLMLRWGERIISVRGLVLLSDCWKHLQRHIVVAGKRQEVDEDLKKQKPNLAAMAASGIPLGGVWFTPFYNTLMSTCQVVVSMDALKGIYEAHLDPETGLMPLDFVYDAIEKIGRPGLPFATFRNFIFALGIKIENQQIALTFQQVDVNQNNCLGRAELRAGTLMLLQQTVPQMLLEKQKLTVQHIVPHIVAALSILGSLFAFLLLSFESFKKTDTHSAFQTLVQSGLALGVTAGVGSESGGADLSKLKDFVLSKLEQIFGVVIGSDVE